MKKFGIEIIDPSGKVPTRAFIGDDDFVWGWMMSGTNLSVEGEVVSSFPQGYAVKDGALVPFEGKPTGDFKSSAVFNAERLVVEKVNMVAKGLTEVDRSEFRKQNVPDARIVAVIPI